MSAKKPARLFLRPARRDRTAVWVILDEGRELSTGCSADDERGAQAKFGQYLAERWQADTGQRDLAQIRIADTLALYMTDVAPTTAAPALIGYHCDHLLKFFGSRTLNQVNGALCRKYAKHRAEQVKASTIRRELVTLQAALNHWHRESPLPAVPRVWKPEESPPRLRYLKRLEVALMLQAARRLRLRYIARMILIGLYTGTRHEATLDLNWYPSTDAGHIDVERGLIFRMGSEEVATKKRRPVSRIPTRLLAHLRRWHAQDLAQGPQTAIIRWKGRRIAKERRAWAKVAKAAGLGPDVTPHVLRHTCATWGLQSGVDIWDMAALTGMSVKTLERVYAHHDPDYQEGVRAATFRRAG